MAKQQEFIDLFAKYDEDKDGQINQQEFTTIITELEVPYQYPGTVSKVIRKLNYANPGKETLNLEQAKEYYNSFESVSKHEIWKAKISLLNKTQEIKQQVSEPKQDSGAAPAAAPGMTAPCDEPEKFPQQARISILIGQHQPVYISEVEVKVDKTEEAQKVKPFVKLTLTSSSEERAKQLETIFKENVTSFFAILSEQQPEYADLFKEIHVNSMVVGSKTTFFITTTNEEVIQYVQLLGEFFELTFSTQLTSKANIRFQFDYDFERFINESNSSFYDIFAKNNRLSIDVTILNLLKSLRKVFKADIQGNPYLDKFDTVSIASLLHIESIEGDFEFENSELTENQTETKEQLNELLSECREFLGKLTESGMKIRQLLQLLDDTISVEFKGGQWKASVFLRLKNFNKILLHKPVPQENSDQEIQQVQINSMNKSASQSSLKSGGSIKKLKEQGLPKENSSEDSLKKKSSNHNLSEDDSDA